MNDVNLPAPPAQETKSIAGCLAEIERGLAGMREALLARNQEAIMAAVSGQERLLKELAAVWRSAQQAPQARSDAIRTTIGRIRGMLRRNAVIARTFLDLINGTIESLNSRAGCRAKDYDATGRVNQRGAPMLVQCKG